MLYILIPIFFLKFFKSFEKSFIFCVFVQFCLDFFVFFHRQDFKFWFVGMLVCVKRQIFIFICRARSFTTLTLRSRMTNELTLLVVQTNASVTSRGTLARVKPARHSRAKCSARSEESCAEQILRNLFAPLNPNLYIPYHISQQKFEKV